MWFWKWVLISKVICGNVVLCFRATLLFNTCLSSSVNFDFRPQFGFAKYTFSRFVYAAITLDTVVLETRTRLAVLDTDAPARRAPIITYIFSSEENITTLCWEQNFLITATPANTQLISSLQLPLNSRLCDTWLGFIVRSKYIFEIGVPIIFSYTCMCVCYLQNYVCIRCKLFLK